MLFDIGYYEKNNMIYFGKHFENILNYLEDYYEEKIDSIPLTDKNEEEKIINNFNNTLKDFKDNRNVLEMIEDNAEKCGDKIAIIYDNESISYKSLNNQANSLANKLLKIGVKKNDFVVILPERGIEMVIGILATLKCGAVYVPIDPQYPNERIEYIINNCKPRVILTYKKELDFIKTIPVFEIIKQTNGIDVNVDIKIEEKDNAYCIFTSGTTGKPKGVLLKHKGLANLVKSYKDVYGLSSDDVLLQFASIAFDQSVWDIFTILTLGGTLCLMPKELINEPRMLEKYMVENNITVTALTPAYIKLLNPENISTLKVIESGSAAADSDVMERWKKRCRVFNTYGPTEATVNTLSFEMKEFNNMILPIGKPISNVNVYIMNNGKLCGIGEPGELCIAGYGVGAGYLNLKEKTEECFIDNPFGEGKMYKTGDLAKWRYDGNVIYIGRMDDQIKIRGFRIELGEIEKSLKDIEYVKDVCLITVTKADNEKEIDAYLTSPKIISIKKIKERLLEKLPHYMIPSHIYQVDTIPLTINGKVDKVKLNNMTKVRQTECAEPSTEFEKVALNIFKEVLMEENIGVTDDFYDIGGSSIKAITIMSKLREKGFNYAVCDILRERTIRKLGKIQNSSCMTERYINLNNKKYKEDIIIHEKKEGIKAKGISYLTPTQIYMLEAYRQHIVGDNFLQYFYKCPQIMNEDNLRKAIDLLTIKNEALTTMIIDKYDRPIQVRYNNRSIELEVINVKNTNELNEICRKDVIRGFDFENDTLIRFKLFKFPDLTQKLVCSLSHIMVDGWSVELIIQDLSYFYEKLEEGIQYEELTKSIGNIKLNNHLERYYAMIDNVDNREAINYWEKYFRNEEYATTIPHNNCSDEIGNLDIVDWIGESETKEIKKFCKNNAISENTFFELAYAYLIAIANEKNDVLFSKVISGRDLPLPGIDNMVGMLINIIPQAIKVGFNVNSELTNLNKTLLVNSKYDKIDFYHKNINGLSLMNEGKTIFVFSSYYELAKSIFEYEFDRDQDDVDLSFFVDSMKNVYHIIITCKKSLYTNERLENIKNIYRKIIRKVLDGENLNDLYL